LAKELNVASKDLVAKLAELGHEVKNHMSAVDAPVVEQIRAAYAKSVSAPASAPVPVAAPAVPETPVKAPEAKSVPAKAPESKAAPSKVPEAKAAPARPAVREPAKTPPKPVAPAPPPAPARPPESAVPIAPVAAPTAMATVSGKVLRVRGAVVVKEFAELLGMRPNQVIAELMGMNVFAAINARLDLAVAKKIAEKHGFVFEHEKKGADHIVVPGKDKIETQEAEDKPEDLVPRPPVVTFLGHVDHGKTSLLDKIRNTSVAAGEHGGITQHVGAYTVSVAGRSITFMDTPGHEAFTAMRARGANMTDIAVIIIAADDGIMPQTREALSHAKAAGVTLMVAINKVDLPGANPARVLQQLQGEGLTSEEWGGETVVCKVSAVTGEGIEHLLEMILLQADVMDLKANPSRRASGFVIEARMEAGMGPTVSLLVTNGTLHVGDTLLCGPFCGKVRALINDHGLKIKSAPPATPVKCLGLPGVPDAGAEFQVYANEKAARSKAEEAMDKFKADQRTTPTRKASLDTLFDKLKDDEHLELRLILKADTQGSVEAITHSISQIKSEKVSINVILSATGNVTTNDVMLASASDAVIMGFHVAREPGVDATAKREGIEVRLHQIIYELLDEVRDAMTGLLKPQLKENVLGHARIKQVFPIGKNHTVAGCLVTDGTVTTKARVRVRRGTEVLYEGGISSLKHFQEFVSEVRQSQECGIRLDRFNDFLPQDILEFFEIQEIAQTL
jgi:translation initiation factor IF-2